MGFRRKIEIRRAAAGYWDNDGSWKAGSRDSIRIMASVQPLNAKEYTQIAVDGTHTVRAVKIYSSEELRTDRGGEADVLLWQGACWKIVQCDPYQMGVLPHYKAIALEVTENEEIG